MNSAPKTNKTKNHEFSSFNLFWIFYLQQHSRPLTRAWHFVGTSMVFVFIALAILWHPLYLLGAPVIAYALAWYSHFFIEGNKPATFGHPFWSLAADFKMYFLTLTGKLGTELQKHGINQD